MAFPQSTRAFTSVSKPEPWGICDRCGFRWLHRQLNWQFDWRGNQLANLRILVCRSCTDVPFELNRPILVGPDPIPVRNPRPGWYATQMQGGPPIAPPLSGEVITDDFGQPIIDDDTGEPIRSDG